MFNNYFYVKAINTITELTTGALVIRKSNIEGLEREQIHQIDHEGNSKFINLDCIVYECYNKNVDEFLFKIKNIDDTYKGIVNIRYDSYKDKYIEGWNINEFCKKFYLYCPIDRYLNPKYQNSNEQYLAVRNDGTVGYLPLNKQVAVSNFGEISSSPDNFEKPIIVEGGNAWKGKTYGIYSPALLNTKSIDIQGNPGVLTSGQIWMETPIILNNLNQNQNEVSRLSQAISGGEEIQGHTIRGRIKEATITSRPVEHRTIFAK